MNTCITIHENRENGEVFQAVVNAATLRQVEEAATNGGFQRYMIDLDNITEERANSHGLSKFFRTIGGKAKAG